MAFTFFNKAYEKRVKEFRSNCGEDILFFADNETCQIDSLPERLNSYEHNLMIPKYSNKLLIEKVKSYIENAGRDFERTDKYVLDATYTEVLKHKLIHMLVERLEQHVVNKEG